MDNFVTPVRAAGIQRWLMIFACVWLFAATLVLTLLIAGVSWIRCPSVVAIYLAATPLFSVLAFAFYGFDKRQAKKNGNRIRERTLQWLAALGGWPGALLGQQFFRHKTQKLRFRLVFWLIVLGHVPLMLASVFMTNIGKS